MTAPRSELIAANLQTTFEAITEANGYPITVSKVERFAVTPQQVQPEHYPFVGIMEDGEETSQTTPGLLRWRWPVRVVAFVRGSSPADAKEKLHALSLSIRKALYEDVTRGAHPDGGGDRNAITSEMVSRRRVRHSDQEFGELHVDLLITYYERPGDG